MFLIKFTEFYWSDEVTLKSKMVQKHNLLYKTHLTIAYNHIWIIFYKKNCGQRTEETETVPSLVLQIWLSDVKLLTWKTGPWSLEKRFNDLAALQKHFMF